MELKCFNPLKSGRFCNLKLSGAFSSTAGFNPLKSGRFCNMALSQMNGSVTGVSIPLNRVGFVIKNLLMKLLRIWFQSP